MTSSAPVISCRNLAFSYAHRQVLDAVSLDFHPGEFVALLGCNGAGKSTLLACLSGLKPCRAERLTVDTLDLESAGRREIAKRLSFVPQEHEDMFPFSVLEVVVMGRTVFLGSFGAPSQKDFKQAQAVLEELQISHLAHRIYTGLSGGEKQMVLLARALVQTRKIVFLDEPTNHLDYSNRYKMLAWLKALTREHQSCVVACLHDPNHAMLFADRVILLDQGRILDEGPVRQVLSGHAVSRLYGLAAWQTRGPGPESFIPAFVHPESAGQVLLLTGDSGEGKTTLLQKVIEKHTHLGFGGIVCPGRFKNGLRHEITIKDLVTGKSVPFARRADDSPRSGFTFSARGEALAREALDPLSVRGCHCAVVDEVGPREIQGKGFSPLLPPLLSMEGTGHIWVVRPEIVDAVCRRWMLRDPVIVRVSQPGALLEVENFLKRNGHD